MYTLQDETRLQAVARFDRDGGSEADYIRSVPLEMADGTIETLAHCQICRAHLENGFIKHLHYCPFEGAADRLRAAAPAMLKALEKIAAGWVLSPDPADWLSASDMAGVARAAIAAVKDATHSRASGCNAGGVGG